MPQSQKQTSPAMDRLLERHPLQRMQSPSRSLSAALHVVGLASFAASYKFLIDFPNHINDAYGWHFQYLTIIGLTLATATFLSGLVSDLTLSRGFFLTKNILSICSAPLALLISLLYWGLRAFNPALVMPPDFELPLRADLGFHLAPSVLLILDLLFFSPPWTITVIPALGLSGVVAFGYWFWVELCRSRNGWYPYPLLEMLGFGQRVGLFAGSAVVMAGSTVVLKWVYGTVNGRARPGAVKTR